MPAGRICLCRGESLVVTATAGAVVFLLGHSRGRLCTRAWAFSDKFSPDLRRPGWQAVGVALRYESVTSREGLQFLRHCYRYVTVVWQRCPREALMDQGFEMHFRESCVLRLNGWLVSQPRELELGADLQTASGLRHEIDVVAR